MELLHLPTDPIGQLNDDASHLMDGLRQDHTRLCGELDVLKRAEISGGIHLWQPLRDVSERLFLGLGEHIRREDGLLVSHHHSVGAAAADAVILPSMVHFSDYRYLQVITRSIALEHRPFLLNSRYQLLKDFIGGLHRHMDEQETELFSVMEPSVAFTAGEEVWNLSP
jgi:hypothetical protein